MSRRDYLERSAWRWTAGPIVSVHSHAMMTSHAHAMLAFKVIHLGLLFGRKCLVERSLCLGMRRGHLRSKGADRVGRLGNPCGIILLNCRFKAVMGRTHLLVGSL